MWYFNKFLTTYAVMPTTSYAVAEEFVPVRGLADTAKCSRENRLHGKSYSPTHTV